MGNSTRCRRQEWWHSYREDNYWFPSYDDDAFWKTEVPGAFNGFYLGRIQYGFVPATFDISKE